MFEVFTVAGIHVVFCPENSLVVESESRGISMVVKKTGISSLLKKVGIL